MGYMLSDVPRCSSDAAHVLGRGVAYREAREAGGGAFDILHCIESWARDKQRRAYEALSRLERDSLDCLQIMPGASELCGFLDTKQIRVWGLLSGR